MQPTRRIIFPAHRLVCVSRSRGHRSGLIGVGLPLGLDLIARIELELSWMRVVASVLRRALIREGLVVTDVVFVEIVTCGSRITGQHAQIADDGADRDIKHVIAKTPPVRPASGNNSADLNGSWISLWSTSPSKMLRREKPSSSGFVWVAKAAARQAHRVGREIHLDQIGDVDSRDIGSVSLDCRYPAKHERLSNRASSGLSAYFRMTCIVARAGAAVEILVRNGDEGLVEERITLTPNLHP